MELDNLHYSTMKIDGCQKPFNFIISEREAGKTTAMVMKIKKAWLSGRPSLVLRRQIADITEIYINDFENVLNKFLKEGQKPYQFYFTKKSCKEGVVDVFCKGDGMKKATLFMRVIALSNPLSRIKSLLLPNIAFGFFDEFICNTRMKEKYLADEAFKFKELYNTFQRECETALKFYFFGNPYSHYNVYFSWLEIDTFKLKQGAFIVGEIYAVECYKILPELKKKILEKNPLYVFDDAYKKYAFDGMAVNDSQINIVKNQPKDARLIYVFRIHGKLLGIFKSDAEFWISIIQTTGKNRQIIAFDFDNLIANSALLSTYEKIMFRGLKNAIGNRQIGYATIESSYLTEEIYTFL